MVGHPRPDNGEVDQLTREFIAESQEGLERMELCLTELEKRPDEVELVSEIFRAVHTIKGTTGFLGFTRLEKLAHAGEHLLVALREGKIRVTPELIGGVLALMDGLRRILVLIELDGTEGKRANDDDCELIHLLEELKSRREPIRESVSPNRESRPLLAEADGTKAAAGPAIQERTLRIDVEVLNRLMNLVGELVLTRNQILQSSPGARDFPELARRLNGVTSDLRGAVMQARMQPVGHLFAKFPRMVRDLARTCGREVRVEFEGQETGLDKSLLEAIRDPLTHAVRNAIDHGIEPAEERLLADKPAQGLVRLRAFHQGGSVTIEVIDDGAGISTERVLAKAVESGLVSSAHAAGMSQREALQMIFVAGLSTAPRVTSVSGRGVGMDVVRANVERVGGSVELESQVGLGTTVRLRVPLTLAIVPALVVRSGGQSFALPQNALVELVYVPRRDAQSAVERIGTAEVYRLRERLLPLVRLDRALKLEPTGVAESRGLYIAVLEAEGRRFGLMVDDLKTPEEIVVKPLSSVLREIGVFSGATMLGNGALAMILDVVEIAARAGVRPAEPAKVLGAEAKAAKASSMGQPAVETESAMVIYESWKVGSGQSCRSARMAIPLSLVERIERIPLSEIEYADGRPVLQYSGEILPLEDRDEVLVDLQAAGAVTGRFELATVLICLRPGDISRRPGDPAASRVGKVVRRVLDVSAGTLLAADGRVREARVAMVKNRVTTVAGAIDNPSDAPFMQLLQEVA
jgi:two-component system chemotaxis sensor kinase CheA